MGPWRDTLNPFSGGRRGSNIFRYLWLPFLLFPFFLSFSFFFFLLFFFFRGPRVRGLDYILVSSNFADNIKNSEIVCGIKSDHSIVSCKVLTKDCPKGKGYWKLNCFYLRHDADFVSFIKSKISEFEEIHEDTDCNPHVI